MLRAGLLGAARCASRIQEQAEDGRDESEDGQALKTGGVPAQVDDPSELLSGQNPGEVANAVDDPGDRADIFLAADLNRQNARKQTIRSLGQESDGRHGNGRQPGPLAGQGREPIQQSR